MQTSALFLEIVEQSLKEAGAGTGGELMKLIAALMVSGLVSRFLLDLIPSRLNSPQKP